MIRDIRKMYETRLSIPLAAALMLFSGCGEKACVECQDGAAAVYCYIGPWPYKICSVDATNAAAQCLEAGGTYVPMTVCDVQDGGETGSDPGGGNESWDPSLSVTFDREQGEYVIDRDALDQLKSDPAPLYGGTTQLREAEGGYYEVAAAGALAMALGWQAEDILLDLDGYNLQGLADFAEAYTVLGDASSFQLTVERAGTAVVLRYRVE